MNANPPQPPSPDRVSALILGAGDGVRLGTPKAFLEAGGATLAEHAIRLLRPFASQVILGLRTQDLAQARARVGKRCTILDGRDTRQGTFARLLDHARNEFVLVHEVARPLATAELCAAVLAACAAHGAATPVIPAGAGDSMSLADGEWLGESLPRERVVRTQTPYAFRREPLLEAVRRSIAQGQHETSVTTLYTSAGERVFLVPGEQDNFKITYADDWQRVQQVLASRAVRT